MQKKCINRKYQSIPRFTYLEYVWRETAKSIMWQNDLSLEKIWNQFTIHVYMVDTGHDLLKQTMNTKKGRPANNVNIDFRI